MHFPKLFILVVLSVLLASCASNRELQRLDALRHDPSWPQIRADAEMEVARRDGDTLWSHSAYFNPNQHTNGVWFIVAAGQYPLGAMGDLILISIRDDGKVISCTPRWPNEHPRQPD